MEQLKATSVQRFIKTNQSKEVIEDKLGVYQPKACINQKYSTTNVDPVQPTNSNNSSIFKFGQLYEDNLLMHIHKHLELDTHHKLLYVGDPRYQLVKAIENYFCLIEPVTTIDLEVISKNNQGNNEISKQVEKVDTIILESEKFDRILIHDCSRNIENLNKSFRRMMSALDKLGKVMFINRPGSISTLPMYSLAKKKSSSLDRPYIKLIQALQAAGSDVEWDLVHVPFRIPKTRWFKMIEHNFPIQPYQTKLNEVEDGIDELKQGMFKYLTDEIVECEDRLFIVSASHALLSCKFPSLQRIDQVPYYEKGDVHTYLPIDEEVKELIEKM